MGKSKIHEIASGLNGSTKFDSKQLSGTDYLEYHENPDTKEIVIIHQWAVPSSEDDVDFEYELVAVFPSKRDFEVYKNQI